MHSEKTGSSKGKGREDSWYSLHNNHHKQGRGICALEQGSSRKIPPRIGWTFFTAHYHCSSLHGAMQCKETSTIIPSVRHSTRERRPLLGSQVPNQSIITARIKLAAKANIQTYIYASTSIHVAQTKARHDERRSSCELHIRYTNAFLDRTGPQPGTHQSLNLAPSRL